MLSIDHIDILDIAADRYIEALGRINWDKLEPSEIKALMNRTKMLNEAREILAQLVVESC